MRPDAAVKEISDFGHPQLTEYMALTGWAVPGELLGKHSPSGEGPNGHEGECMGQRQPQLFEQTLSPNPAFPRDQAPAGPNDTQFDQSRAAGQSDPFLARAITVYRTRAASSSFSGFTMPAV
jgi:hypothetical protein